MNSNKVEDFFNKGFYTYNYDPKSEKLIMTWSHPCGWTITAKKKNKEECIAKVKKKIRKWIERIELIMVYTEYNVLEKAAVQCALSWYNIKYEEDSCH